MGAAETSREASRALGFRDLTLFNLAAVVGIRWIAAAAHVGLGSVSLWFLAAALFFVPSALAVSRLARAMPEDGGLYQWTRGSFGPWWGFLCGWCYWVSNIFYFPQLLLSGVAVAARALGPRYQALADDRVFIIAATLALLWFSVGTNIVGLRIGKWTENLGGVATYLAGALIIVLGGAVFWHRGFRFAGASGAARFSDFLPAWDWGKLNFWSQITFAFGGLELAPVLCGEIRDPRRTVPRAAWLSGGLIAIFYVVGTLGILAALPAQAVNPVDGLIQAVSAAGQALGLAAWALPTLAGALGLCFAVSVMGQLGAWMVGSARLPTVNGMRDCFPAALSRFHPRWGTPYVSLLAQGVACSVFLLATQLGETVRSGYQLLVDMTVISYFVPFLLLFLVAVRHGLRLSGAAGFTVTAVGLGLTFVPPDETASAWVYESKLGGGMIALVVVARILYLRAGNRGKAGADPVPPSTAGAYVYREGGISS